MTAPHDRLAAKMREFAGTVTQGDWSDGFSLPFAYLWSADKLLFIAWLVAIVAALAWHAWASLGTTRPQSPFALLFRRRLGADPQMRAALLVACSRSSTHRSRVDLPSHEYSSSTGGSPASWCPFSAS